MTGSSTRVRPAVLAGPGRLKAAWTLVLLAPLCAEASLSGISLPLIWLALPLLVPFYGAGVLLIRELACRAGVGWPGLLVLGLAYELVEDGIALQALTSPKLYRAAEWGPRILGTNTTYWESQIGYHLVFSVLIPVALTDLIFERHVRRPYLGTFGLIGTAVVFVLGIALVRFGIAGTEDPGYQMSVTATVVQVVAIVLLGVLALVVLPRLRAIRPAPVARLPRPGVLALVGGLTPIVFLGLLFPLHSRIGEPALGQAIPVPIPMVLALLLAVGAGWLVARWVVTDGFSVRHRLWLIGGALVGHSLFALVTGVASGHHLISPVIGVVVIALTVLLLVLLGRRIERRAG